MTCVPTPYEKSGSVYTKSSSVYAKKTSNYAKKSSYVSRGEDVYDTAHICPALLQESGGLIYQENGNYILI